LIDGLNTSKLYELFLVVAVADTNEELRHMRFYIFKSEATKNLRAFAGDVGGTKLPGQHAPWTVTGVVGDQAVPPHNLSRETIEEAIESAGFQLWRLKSAEA
jgi:hypothetical protein